MQRSSDNTPTPQPGNQPEQRPEGETALPRLHSAFGEVALFETTPRLRELIDHGILQEDLKVGDRIQAHFAVDKYTKNPTLLFNDNTSYRFILSEETADSLAIKGGYPIRAVLEIEGNFSSTNDEGLEYIHRQSFRVTPLAVEYAPINPTPEQIEEMPPNVGFLVTGMVTSDSPVTVRTEAGHDLIFEGSTLPFFQSGVLEYSKQQQLRVGDSVEFTAARSRQTYGQEPSNGTVPKIHFATDYGVLKLTEPSEERQREYLMKRANHKIELVDLLNAISQQRFEDARQIVASLASKPLIKVERQYLTERIEMMPAAERPVHPNISTLFEKSVPSYMGEKFLEEYGVSIFSMPQLEFADFCERLSQGEHPRPVAGRLPSMGEVNQLYYLVEQNSPENLRYNMQHVRAMVEASKVPIEGLDPRHPSIAIHDATSWLAYHEDGQHFLCDQILDLVEDGSIAGIYDQKHRELYTTFGRLIESVESASAAGKMSPAVLIAHQETFHKALAAVFRHEGYGGGQGIAGHLTKLRERANLVKAGYDLGVSDRRSDPRGAPVHH